MVQRYPLWVKVDGPGHAQNPGFVLVENEDQEAEALGTGKGPAELNPAPAEGKSYDEMDKAELVEAVIAKARTSDASEADLRFVITILTGDVDKDRDDAEPEAEKDAAGDEIAPDPADEANKGDPASEATRTAPEAQSAPANDARPDDAKAKEPDDHPAGNVTEQAATPPDHKRGSRRGR